MVVLQTTRLTLHRFTEDDAPFIKRLVNEPSWRRYIGDKGVRTLDDARAYLRNGPLDMYARYGYGLYLVLHRQERKPLGMCGLVRRDALPEADVGFAFVPEAWGHGYAVEAAAAVIEHARALGLKRILAVTSLDNDASIRVLEKCGFNFEGVMELTPNDPVRLYAQELG